LDGGSLFALGPAYHVPFQHVRDLGPDLTSDPAACAFIAEIRVFFDCMSNRKRRSVRLGFRLDARVTDALDGTPDRRPVVEIADIQYVVGSAEPYLPVAFSAAESHEPDACALAFPVTKVNIGVDATPIETRR
jgi:hypothetical protein